MLQYVSCPTRVLEVQLPPGAFIVASGSARSQKWVPAKHSRRRPDSPARGTQQHNGNPHKPETHAGVRAGCVGCIRNVGNAKCARGSPAVLPRPFGKSHVRDASRARCTCLVFIATRQAWA